MKFFVFKQKHGYMDLLSSKLCVYGRPVEELTAWIRKAKRNHLMLYLASHVG